MLLLFVDFYFASSAITINVPNPGKPLSSLPSSGMATPDSSANPKFDNNHPDMESTTLPFNHTGHALVVMVCVLMAISIATTLLRVSIRGISRLLGWDDALIVLGLVFLVVHSSCEVIAGNAGLGLHSYEVPPDNISQILKFALISQLFLMLSLCFTKCSICLFVLRIQNWGWLRWALRALIIGFVVTELPVFIFWFLNCTPIEAFWTGNFENCHAAQYYNDLVWLQIAFSIVGDVACAILPVIILRKIQLKKDLKIAVCGLMMLGLVATVCSVGRAVATAQLNVADNSYSLAPIQFWSSAEGNFAVIGANLTLSRMVWVFYKNKGKRSAVRVYEEMQKPSSVSRPRGRKPVRTFDTEERGLAARGQGHL